MFELHRLGRTRVVYERRSLDEVNTCIDEVLSGRTTARVVFDVAGGRAASVLVAAAALPDGRVG